MKVSQFLIGFIIFFTGFANAESEYRQQDAHQHGKAELSIAISKQDVLIELHSPAYNILGFEHQPTTEQQKQVLVNALTLLKTANKVVEISKSAQCLLKSVELESPYNSHQEESNDPHHEDEHEEHHEEDTHSDFTVVYQYQCKQRKNLRSINLKPLFDNLPSFEQLDVQWLNENHQSAKSLNSSNTRIDY